MEASHKTHRPHIKVGKDAEEEEDRHTARQKQHLLRLTCHCLQLQCHSMAIQRRPVLIPERSLPHKPPTIII